MSTNPYIEEHVRAEQACQDDDQLARQIVEGEYADAPDAVEHDGCGGTGWYKATIGAHKCDRCGDLYHGGDWLGGPADRPVRVTRYGSRRGGRR